MKLNSVKNDFAFPSKVSGMRILNIVLKHEDKNCHGDNQQKEKSLL